MSGYSPLATSPASTVVGTVMPYQPLGVYSGLDSCAPVSFTASDDCICQPSDNKVVPIDEAVASAANTPVRAFATTTAAAPTAPRNVRRVTGARSSLIIVTSKERQNKGLHVRRNPRRRRMRAYRWGALKSKI